MNNAPSWGQMVVAFDWHGCLDTRWGLRQLAKWFASSGARVIVISGVIGSLEGEERLRTTQAIMDRIEEAKLPVAHVHFVFMTIEELRQANKDTSKPPDYSMGVKKAEVMRKAGANLMFDDNPGIVEAIRDSGFTCWHVGAD